MVFIPQIPNNVTPQIPKCYPSNPKYHNTPPPVLCSKHSLQSSLRMSSNQLINTYHSYTQCVCQRRRVIIKASSSWAVVGLPRQARTQHAREYVPRSRSVRALPTSRGHWMMGKPESTAIYCGRRISTTVIQHGPARGTAKQYKYCSGNHAPNCEFNYYR